MKKSYFEKIVAENNEYNFIGCNRELEFLEFEKKRKLKKLEKESFSRKDNSRKQGHITFGYNSNWNFFLEFEKTRKMIKKLKESYRKR